MTVKSCLIPPLVAVPLFALFACGHGSERDNPLDPELTPAVELQIALDDSAGTTTLSWTPYEGATAFAEYLVLRNPSERTTVDTLARIAEVGETSYVDTTVLANTAYVYRVSVVNTSLYEVPSTERRTDGFDVDPVELLSATYDPELGGVVVRWSHFASVRFESYQVQRISADKADFAAIGSPVESAGDTTFIDTEVLPDVFYRYRVVVVAADQQWTSNDSAPLRFLSGSVFLLPVELDTRNGMATLSWSRYDGDEPFQSYEVRRRLAGDSEIEVLGSISERDETEFDDRTFEADNFYLYTVVVITSAGKELASDPVEAFFRIEPSVLDVTFDRQTAAAELSWTRAVAGFEHYEIQRRSLSSGELIQETIFDIDDTTFVDMGLEENVEYRYSIITFSRAGSQVESAPVHGPVQERIAFYSRRGNWDVYVMNPDGSDQVNLTDHPAIEGPGSGFQVGRPAWSPDGQRILFWSNRDNRNGDVFVMNADGSDQVNLTNGSATDYFPSWSSDGSRIAFASGRAGGGVLDVYMMDADGSNVTRLTDTPAHDGWPAWSPDGNRIAFTSLRDGNYEIYMMNADGSNQVNITNNSDRLDWDADWSPDGTRITWESSNLDFEETDVYVMDADGGNVINLTNSPTGDVWPDWSHDGTRIAFTSDRDDNRDNYVMDADGSNLIRLTTNPGFDSWPSFRPVPE